MALGESVKSILKVGLRLTLPVVLLLASYGLAFFGQRYAIILLDNQEWLGQSGLKPSLWLTAGHIAIMLSFFLVIVTNRLFGPAYALLQIVIAWLIAGALRVFAWPQLTTLLHQDGTVLPPQDVMLIFLGALALAHLVSIVMFDSMRGRPWWRAPLLAALAGAVILPAVYWPALHPQAVPWISRLTLDLALKVAAAFVLLAPYALLRPITRPRDGFGGY